MEDKKTTEITDDFFQKEPFTIKLKKGELTSETLEDIYMKTDSFSKNIKEYLISTDKYNISFEKESNFTTINFYNGDDLVYSFNDFLQRPINVIINIDHIKTTGMKIFSLEAYDFIKDVFSNHRRYIFTENKESNTIELKNNEYTIPDNIINIYLNVNDNYKNYDSIKDMKNNIKIDPLFLSSNFYDIFPEVKRTTDFELILNDERKVLLDKLDSFIKNDKKYYWFIGSDGIGKSISLLYFSSLKNYKIIYFNLKLYVNASKEDEIQQYFYNDIHKFYLKDIKTKKYADSINFNYSQNIKKIVEKNSKNKDSSVLNFWNYLYNFIEVNLGKNNYIIIIDQYKTEKYDPKFKGLNKIANLIRAYKKKIKIILSTSMNNTCTKEDFIQNLDNIYNIEDHQISLEEILEIEKNNPKKKEQIDLDFEEDNNIKFDDGDDFDNKSDCSFCQKMIIEEQKEFQEQVPKEEKERIVTESECILDKIFSKTQRDYYGSLVSGKEIYKTLLNEEEYIIAKNFDYNLKYITKYLYFKKNEEEKGNKDINDIINKFYSNESNKMRNKINDFYQLIINDKTKKLKYSDPFELEFQSLCNLRSYIIEGYKLKLTDLSNEIYYFPMKYLSITLFPINTNYFSLNQDLSSYRFKIHYNNNFFRVQINCIINDIYKKITNFSLNSFGGSALGNILEIQIDEIFRTKNKNKFGFYDYNCRNLFSLVPNTDNSSKTIQEHRKNEKNLIIQYFGKQYYNKIIDDIDDINKQNNFIFDKDLYYISQISFTGRAFDMAVLKKEYNNHYVLFLYQVSKNKQNELKSKIYYITEAKKVINNLCNIYKININRIYLSFILPLNSVTDKFQQNLMSNGLNYIFFDVYTNKFVDKLNKIEINSLELKESLLDYNPDINISDLQNIINLNNIWEKSVKKFLNRKLNRDDLEKEIEKGDSLHKIYINELFNSNLKEQTKLIIPKNLETKIKNEIIHEENVKLKFLNSFDFVNIKEVAKLYRTLNIFVKDKKIYLYYEYIYSYENDEFKKVNDEEKIFSTKTIKKRGMPKKTIKNKRSGEKEKDEYKKEDDKSKNLNLKAIALNKINEKIVKINLNDLYDEKYERKCFCFLIIGKDYIKGFFDY